MTAEKNLPSPAIAVTIGPKDPAPVELSDASQRKVIALRKARDVIATNGGIFGNSSIKDGFDHYTLMSLADYILTQPDVSEPGESEPESDQDETVGQIPDVTGRITGVLFATDRVRKTPTDREVERPDGVEFISHRGQGGWWICASDRPLMKAFDETDLGDAVRGWPGLTSAKGNPVREVTSGHLLAKQVFDPYNAEWVGYTHGGRL